MKIYSKILICTILKAFSKKPPWPIEIKSFIYGPRPVQDSLIKFLKQPLKSIISPSLKLF